MWNCMRTRVIPLISLQQSRPFKLLLEIIWWRKKLCPLTVFLTVKIAIVTSCSLFIPFRHSQPSTAVMQHLLSTQAALQREGSKQQCLDCIYCLYASLTQITFLDECMWNKGLSLVRTLSLPPVPVLLGQLWICPDFKEAAMSLLVP